MGVSKMHIKDHVKTSLGFNNQPYICRVYQSLLQCNLC
jgi:hypothetical protein